MTSPKFFCFVLMPFTPQFDDIYQQGIKESCKNADTYCERVDEQTFEETILNRIYNQIAKADLIIADMTGKNPNVFYEVGYAHALNKPTILLTQDSADIPFDLKHFPHIIYENKISKIREELTKKVAWFKENSILKNEKLFKNEIELYFNKQKLSSGEAVYLLGPDWPRFSLTIYNASPFTYQTGEFQIGIISSVYDLCHVKGRVTILLPEGQYLHMLPFSDLLFPGSYTSVISYLSSSNINFADIKESQLTFRVFTESGYRDHFLMIKKSV